MKRFFNFLPVLGMLLLTGCDGTFFGDDDSSTNPADLTAGMTDFIKANYAGYNIEDIEFEDICDVKYYEIELEDGPGPDVELYFTLDEVFAFAVTEISENALPQAVLDAIAQHFSGYKIDDDDLEKFELADGSLQFAVELESDDDDLDMIFNSDGSVFCQDDSDDDDDDDDDD